MPGFSHLNLDGGGEDWADGDVSLCKDAAGEEEECRESDNTSRHFEIPCAGKSVSSTTAASMQGPSYQPLSPILCRVTSYLSVLRYIPELGKARA